MRERDSSRRMICTCWRCVVGCHLCARRLYPSVPLDLKECQADITLPGGHEFKKGVRWSVHAGVCV